MVLPRRITRASFLVRGTTLRALAQVGHIRVYAALASLLSASVLVSGVFDSPIVWIIMRVSTGFCYAGLYVVAESWLNGLATNTFRGRLLAVYNVVTVGAYVLDNCWCSTLMHETSQVLHLPQ